MQNVANHAKRKCNLERRRKAWLKAFIMLPLENEGQAQGGFAKPQNQSQAKAGRMKTEKLGYFEAPTSAAQGPAALCA